MAFKVKSKRKYDRKKISRGNLKSANKQDS